MGDFLSGVLGTKSNYQAQAAATGNPYDQSVLQNAVNQNAQLYANQQALAQQLQSNLAGRGPNPAQTQYQQNAQQNINNAQGLISSQRGLNPALATRLGANAATNANQQAAAQSSILQQNQQLGALQGLENLYGQQQQGNLAQQQLYVAPNTAAQQIGADVAKGNAANNTALIGGVIKGLSSGAAAAAAHGGMIEEYANGGPISIAGKHLSKAKNFKPGGPVPGRAAVKGDSYANDTVPAIVSPGEIVLPRHITQADDAPKKAAAFVAAILAKKKGKSK